MAALKRVIDIDAELATEELETDLLLEALYQRFGFDFRAYERSALQCKLHAFMASRRLATISQVQDRSLHDAAIRAALLRCLSIGPVALFDDPMQARSMRRVLAQSLGGSALPKIWLAECAGAEQAWSVAILLADEQLHGRTEIFATMSNEEMLAEAAEASIPTERIAEYQENYMKSGGRANLAAYFDIKGKRAVLKAALRDRITWAQYNLVTDASFNEFQVIVCRHALADFGPLLRRRALKLFDSSLARFGVLGLDRQLDQRDPLAQRYQLLFPQQCWYKRIA